MAKNQNTTEQRLAGAFVEVNTSASMVLEMLEAMRDPEPVEGWRLEAMSSHMQLMVQRIGYVNQVAAHLTCPGTNQRTATTRQVVAHNHSPGSAQPSRADEALAQSLKGALSLVDVRVLDHVIVSAGAVLSMAERELL